jgi:hypothetical protein
VEGSPHPPDKQAGIKVHVASEHTQTGSKDGAGEPLQVTAARIGAAAGGATVGCAEGVLIGAACGGGMNVVIFPTKTETPSPALREYVASMV